MDTEHAEKQSQVVLESVQQVEEYVNQISMLSNKEMLQNLSKYDQAKWHVYRAFAIYSLVYNYYQLSGATEAASKIVDEIQRLRTYFAKIEQYASQHQMERPSWAAPGPTTKVNQEAAKRVITHYTPSQASVSVGALGLPQQRQHISTRKKNIIPITAPKKRQPNPKSQVATSEEDPSPSKREKIEKI